VLGFRELKRNLLLSHKSPLIYPSLNGKHSWIYFSGDGAKLKSLGKEDWIC
jgi:hypothetical protein